MTQDRFVVSPVVAKGMTSVIDGIDDHPSDTVANGAAPEPEIGDPAGGVGPASTSNFSWREPSTTPYVKSEARSSERHDATVMIANGCCTPGNSRVDTSGW